MTFLNAFRSSVSAVQFSGTSQSFYGAAAFGAVATARVRFRLDALPDLTFRIIAGPNTGSGGGWLVNTEDTFGGAAVGQLVIYGMVGSTMTRIARKFLMPDDIGRIFTVHLVGNGTDLRAYLDGHLIGMPVAGAMGASSNILNIGGRSTGANASPVTVLDVAEGTTALSAAEVAGDATSIAPAFVDQTHRYVAAPGITTTWTDQVGTANLTAFGSPSAVTITPNFGNHRGGLQIWGDSIAAGRQASPAGSAGDGWRRAMQRAASTSNTAITMLGNVLPNSPTTFDYDYWSNATGGEALSTRLSTLAADLTTTAPTDAAVLLAYGINDLVALGRTAVQLKADVTTACGYIASARPGRPIFVCNMLPANALTTSQQTEWDSYQSGFAAFIATLQATYPTVVGIDYAGVVTNAADTAQLFDGTHPTPTTYAAMAAVIQPIVSAAM